MQMIGFLREWITNIVFVVIIATFVENICPSKKMKKYIGMITGFIIIIVIINPFLNLVQNGITMPQFDIDESNEDGQIDIAKKTKMLEEENTNRIIKVYKNKLSKAIEENIAKVSSAKIETEIIVNEDKTSEFFGEVNKVIIYVDPDEENKKDNTIKIDKIEVETKDMKEKTEQISDYSNLEKTIRENVRSFLNIDQEKIKIIILEKG